MGLLAFPDLTPTQRGIDAQFACIKEDFIQGLLFLLFQPDRDKSQDGEKCKQLLGKWFPILEGKVPADGFVNGLDTPTTADLAVLQLVKASHIFSAAIKLAEVDMEATYPKMAGVANRTAEAP